MAQTPPLSLMAHPHEQLIPLTGGRNEMKAAARIPGSVLVWAVDAMKYTQSQLWVEQRPVGLALLVILPPVGDRCAHLPAVRSLRARITTSRG
jgi:hypothetical protein